MKELADLEICKRIAEIEGVKFTIHEGLTPSHPKRVFQTHENLSEGAINSSSGWYDPLTDDALCFRLMIEHDIKVSKYYKLGDEQPFYGAETSCLEEVEARSANKVVCLTIIMEQE
jgi:hypothetical protein